MGKKPRHLTDEALDMIARRFAVLSVPTLMLFIKRSKPTEMRTATISPATIAAYGELIDLDLTLRDAMPPTNTENLETLLNLPLSNGHRS